MAMPFFRQLEKVASVLGGAYGKGQVYRGGKVTGTTSLVKATIGFQLGGQVFSEIIFLDDLPDFSELKLEGNLCEVQGDYALENVKVYAADDHGLSIKTKENRHIFVSTPFGSPSWGRRYNRRSSLERTLGNLQGEPSGTLTKLNNSDTKIGNVHVR
jgi:hypothetical protein